MSVQGVNTLHRDDYDVIRAALDAAHLALARDARFNGPTLAKIAAASIVLEVLGHDRKA